jgi:hypothetical protein
MSLATVHPSTSNRTARRGRRPRSVQAEQVPRQAAQPGPARSGGARLCLVQDEPQDLAPRTQAARERQVHSGAGHRPASAVPGPLRLTRRGRIVVRAGTAVLVLLTLISAVLLLNRTAQAGSQSHPIPATYRVVLPGETLWQIAGEVAPRADRRDTVAEILELNALSSAEVSAGQRIAVPGPSS